MHIIILSVLFKGHVMLPLSSPTSSEVESVKEGVEAFVASEKSLPGSVGSLNSVSLEKPLVMLAIACSVAFSFTVVLPPPEKKLAYV